MYDEGLITSVISDVSVNYNGYAPENYDRVFNGYVSMGMRLTFLIYPLLNV
jgi:membrane carboxypeptidase/penicillin-binding protein PbpC